MIFKSQHRPVEYLRENRFIDVWNEVPLVPQMTGMSCWAASAAMLVGWREQRSVNPEEVAAGSGHWRAFREGLNPRDVTSLISAWRLVPLLNFEWSVNNLYNYLRKYGPLWMGEASPGLHSIVITGIYGDGSEIDSMVRINDPWPIGNGERYLLPFHKVVRNYFTASHKIGQLAHLLHSGGRSFPVEMTKK